MKWMAALRQNKHRQLLVAGSLAGIIIIVCATILLWPSPKMSQAQIDKAKSEEIIKKVSDLFIVPKEVPTVAELENPKNLQDNQEFFKNAQAGDYVLVYGNAQMVVIYREKEDKLVNAGSITIGGQSAGPSDVQQ
jgi:hypothetical protein